MKKLLNLLIEVMFYLSLFITISGIIKTERMYMTVIQVGSFWYKYGESLTLSCGIMFVLLAVAKTVIYITEGGNYYDRNR